jgi:predicted enzyme related to lactoylglutathione lyase
MARFNHMELTVPKGTLTGERRAELSEFYGNVFGWETRDVEILGGLQYFMRPDDGQFILVAESSKPMSSPGYDHLGLLMDSREEVDHVLEQCQRFKEKDDRVELKLYNDLHTGNTVVHAFYVKYLLPIWFDVQVLEQKAGTGPAKRWQYV